MKALQIMASAIGKSIGGISVRVDPQATTAMTNGRVVILPVLPTLSSSEEQENVLLGMVCHEAFHIRYTFYGKERDHKPEQIQYTPFKKELENALEDIRIERRGMERYPGTRKYLLGLVRFCVKQQWFPDAPGPTEHPANLVIYGLLFLYRRTVLKQPLAKASKNWVVKAIEVFGSDLWKKIVSIADSATVSSAVDAADGPWWAAEKIALLLGSSADLPEEAKKSVGAGEGDLRFGDIGKIVKIDASSPVVQSSGSRLEELPVVERVSQPRLQPAKTEAQRIYRKICGSLEAKLWATSQSEEWVSRTGTYGVASSALHQAGTTGRVFRSRIEGDSRSIAVHLLIDNSGSMGDVDNDKTAAYWAHAGAIALAKLFSSVGIEWSISWFGHFWARGRGYSSAPLRDSDGWYGTSLGGTDLVGSMSQAGMTLLPIEADRKLLLVLTDGLVKGDALPVMDNSLAEQGIETRYALIGTLSGFEFAGSRVCSGSGEDAAKTLMGAFRTFV